MRHLLLVWMTVAMLAAHGWTVSPTVSCYHAHPKGPAHTIVCQSRHTHHR